MKHHAVDLDGTLAYYDEYIPGHIGEPIPLILDRINKWLESGDKVTIFTARLKEHPEDKELIEDWLLEHIGQKLPVTNEKSPDFSDIHDDRAVAIEKNTGRILGADKQTGFGSKQEMNTESVEREKMSAKSGKQYRFMAGIAHGMEPTKTKSMGPSVEVAREFVEKTPAKKRSQFSKSLRKKRKGNPGSFKGASY